LDPSERKGKGAPAIAPDGGDDDAPPPPEDPVPAPADMEIQ